MDPFIHKQDDFTPGPILAVTRWPEGMDKTLAEGITSVICNNKSTPLNGKQVPFRKITNISNSKGFGIEDHDDSVKIDDQVVNYSSYDTGPNFTVLELRRREVENILQHWIKFCQGKKIGECSIDVVVFELTEHNGNIVMGGAWEYKKCIPTSLETYYGKEDTLKAISIGGVEEETPTVVTFSLQVLEYSDYFSSKKAGIATFNALNEAGAFTLASVVK